MGITDSGILTIACGCPNLEMINIAYLKDITDSSLLSLSKCSRLNTFESRGCPLITSLGLAAIAVGCKQLIKLDIKWCHNINDVGMLPLAHFSQNLRQVDSRYFLLCSSVTSTCHKMEVHTTCCDSHFSCRLIYHIPQLRMWGSCPWQASAAYRT